MGRRSNSTTANGNVESFDNAPIRDDGIGGNENIVDEGGLPTVNPAELGSAGNGDDGNIGGYGLRVDGTPAKKRGRKPGQKSGQGQTRHAVSVSGLEKTLIGIHSAVAAMAHDPSWNLSKEEAKALSDAGAAVAQHYEVAVNPKTRDWLILLGVIGTLYGPRVAPMVFALFGKKKPVQRERAEIDKTNPAVEMPFSNLPPIAGVPMTH